MTLDPIRVDEVLAELAKLNAERPDGFTARDLSEALGIGLRSTGEKIRTLVRAGRLEFAGRISQPYVDGRMGLVPVYRIKK